MENKDVLQLLYVIELQIAIYNILNNYNRYSVSIEQI